MIDVVVDEDRLDDADAIERADPGSMLRALASAAAQVRSATTAAVDAGFAEPSSAARPRALVVAGMGGSGIAGEALSALCGAGCPVPVIVHRGYGLPGWVGAADVVVTVSSSGSTEETLSAAEEAVRRGSVVLGIGAPDSPLAQLLVHARGRYAAVAPEGRQPRALLWQLLLPLVVLADSLGVLDCPPVAREGTARRLEEVSLSCRVDREAFVNPAKSLALDFAGALPLIWGSGTVGPVAALRAASQLHENAKYPAISGGLPEASHNQVVAFDGPFVAAADDDLFRDRLEDPTPAGLRLLLLRDTDEHPQIARRVHAIKDIAAERGLPVHELSAAGASPLERLASLVALVDYATVYLAIACGIDPTPIGPITELKRRIAD